MCLLSVAYKQHPDYPLVFIGNRDEYHARETAPAEWWPADDSPPILAGRDLQAGGTWLGINRLGRFSVVTNRPDLPPPEENARSRGDLNTTWLSGHELLPELEETHADYGGFSLLLIDEKLQILTGGFGMGHLTANTFEQGIFGLSNTSLDQPWPKLNWLNAELERTLSEGEPDTEQLMSLLGRTDPVPEAASHGVPATPFVLGEAYGTRCCTVVTVRTDGLYSFTERRFGPGGSPLGEAAFEFQAE
ncbi:MAG: NRDE family protein [Gammaproteobacteria bacterium]